MVWPTADIPTYGRGVWLECNGQSFSRTQFPQLYESLGTTRVPDYRGVFLRGYGSQSEYSSGSIGSLQGDAGRRLRSYGEGINGGGWGESHSEVFSTFRSLGYDDYGDIIYDTSHVWTTTSEDTTRFADFSGVQSDGFQAFTYDISCGEDSCSISSTPIPFTGHIVDQYIFEWDNEKSWPIAEEFRPANIAVKFMIKAK